MLTSRDSWRGRCAADFDWDAVVPNMVYVWTGLAQAAGLRYYGIPGINIPHTTGFNYIEPPEGEAFAWAIKGTSKSGPIKAARDRESALAQEEHNRLLYVAMTRAKRSLSLIQPFRFHVVEQPR